MASLRRDVTQARAHDLVSARLELRASVLGDLGELHALWTDAEVRRFLFDDRRISESEAQAFVQASVVDFAARGYGIWLVFEKGRRRLAGFAGLLRNPEGPPNLVYGIRPDLAARGYATEAARAVLDHSFAALGLAEIAADVDEPNAASIRVLEKLGMRQVRRGEVNGRPLLYFAIDAPRDTTQRAR
jgi:RimJ/RimL family protein N-acetyltransferase